jgi:hypothetical protein
MDQESKLNLLLVLQTASLVMLSAISAIYVIVLWNVSSI